MELWPENQEAWELYQLVRNQLLNPYPLAQRPILVLDYRAVDFIFSLYIPNYAPEEKQKIFEKILIIHGVAQKKNG